mmetsp:Transcript_24859/g.38291  ORF Transcript_24859/g.38291 Transcript_24859/m.38291 type:complete len:266 (-) Transcript_24859:573-1370(-)
MFKLTHFALMVFALLKLHQSHAQIYGSQDFNSLNSSNAATSDGVTSGSNLTNAGAFNIGGAGLDFFTKWEATRSTATTGPVTSGESGDFIGVNSFTGSNAPNVGPNGTSVNSDSEKNFQFNDCDGKCVLQFEAVDLGSATAPVLKLSYWAADTGYESDDLFSVTILSGAADCVLLSFSEIELEAANTIGDTGSVEEWNTLIGDIKGTCGNSFPLDSVVLQIAVDTNSGAENVFVDDISFMEGGDITDAPTSSPPAVLTISTIQGR